MFRFPRLSLPDYLLARRLGLYPEVLAVSRFGDPRIKAYLQLPEAYRSLSRPSSASDAKASTTCTS